MTFGPNGPHLLRDFSLGGWRCNAALLRCHNGGLRNLDDRLVLHNLHGIRARLLPGQGSLAPVLFEETVEALEAQFFHAQEAEASQRIRIVFDDLGVVRDDNAFSEVGLSARRLVVDDACLLVALFVS